MPRHSDIIGRRDGCSETTIATWLWQIFLCSAALLLCAFAADAQSLPAAPPESVGMSSAKLAAIDKLVAGDIADSKLPGAVVLIGHEGKIVYRKAFGSRSLIPAREAMTPETIFDLASLTKSVATATSIMILVERGQLRLNDAVGKFIPEIEDPAARRVTIQQLLTHTAGYAPDFDLKEKWTGRDGMLQALYKEKLKSQPGTKFVYSDIGFIILGEIVGRVSGSDLAAFANSEIFGPLNNKQSFFAPIQDQAAAGWASLPGGVFTKFRKDLSEIAPTENIKGQNSYLGGEFTGTSGQGSAVLRGAVHDPTAFRMGGIAGHAGLFSTADDLARFCQMLLDGGLIPGAAAARGAQRRILSAQTVAKMTAPIIVSETGAARGLGWDINTAFSSNRGELFSLGSFGHTGFTGTSIWIDRVTQTFVIFLSNRVHPNGTGDVTPLRARVATVAAAAIEDTPIEAYRLAASVYSSQVAAQLPAFQASVDAGGRPGNAASSRIGDRTDSRKAPVVQTVLNGIDVLARDNFKQLDKLKIGLVTNQTGRTLDGKSTIDTLFGAKNVKLAALFSPEHGIRGELDQAKIDNSKDEKTGLPIYSLYGESRRPAPEQLAGLDAVVYDIQDVGTRFYTYTSTLRYVMEEAAKAGKPVVVLDRPNPLNGDDIEGPLASESKLSFIAAHTLPVRYGLTIGELAMMMNAERKIGADLRVIKMDGWTRRMWFDETGQTWVNPSPNMRSLTEATLYPGIGLLETTNVSVGRGTDTPFELVGAPWIDGRRLATTLNGAGLDGVRFVPVNFTPSASVFAGQSIGGVNIIITDREGFEPVKTGVEIARALNTLYPDKWEIDKFARLLAGPLPAEVLAIGDGSKAVDNASADAIEEFKRRRAPFLLYK